MSRIEFTPQESKVFGFNAEFVCHFRDEDTVIFSAAITRGKHYRFEREGNEIECYLDLDEGPVHLGTCTGRPWEREDGRSGVDWRGGNEVRDWFRSQSETRGWGAGYMFGWYWPLRAERDPLGFAVKRFLRCLYYACDQELGRVPWRKREDAE